MGLAWTLKPSPSWWPASGMQAAPVCAPADPFAARMATWRTAVVGIGGHERRERLLRRFACLE
jgi:hypothetical protein